MIPSTNAAPNQVSGTLLKVEGSNLTMKTRTGTKVQINATAAIKAHQVAGLTMGAAVTVEGAHDKSGGWFATSIFKADQFADRWPQDKF